VCMQCAQGTSCWLLMQVTISKAEDHAVAAEATRQNSNSEANLRP